MGFGHKPTNNCLVSPIIFKKKFAFSKSCTGPEKDCVAKRAENYRFFQNRLKLTKSVFRSFYA